MLHIRHNDPNGYGRHVIAGAAIGTVTAGAAYLVGMPATVAAAGGSLAATVIGALKAFHDAFDLRHVVNWKGAVFTALGGLAALLILLAR